MKRRCSIALLSLLISGLLFPPENHAGDKPPQDRQTLTFRFENDLFAQTDKQYTNGMALTWLSPDLTKFRDDRRIPSWAHSLIEHLPLINEPGFQRNISLSLVQKMYTPEDIHRSDLVADDRPYAGITTFAIGLHCKNSRRMDTIEIDLGIIGPHSYADEVQKVIHELTGSPQPRGWEHQIGDEPIFNLFYERKWRWASLRYREDYSGDMISHVGAGLGNAYIGANSGLQLRFGYHLPQDFGTYVIRPGTETGAPLDTSDPRLYQNRRRFGVHLFGGIDGRAVVRNIALDGNTCKDSHRVEKEPLVADFIIGVGVLIQRFKITYAYVVPTREFKLEKSTHIYGSISASYSF